MNQKRSCFGCQIHDIQCGISDVAFDIKLLNHKLAYCVVLQYTSVKQVKLWSVVGDITILWVIALSWWKYCWLLSSTKERCLENHEIENVFPVYIVKVIVCQTVVVYEKVHIIYYVTIDR